MLEMVNGMFFENKVLRENTTGLRHGMHSHRLPASIYVWVVHYFPMRQLTFALGGKNAGKRERNFENSVPEQEVIWTHIN